MYNQYLDGSEFVLLEPEPQNTPPGHHQGQPNQRPQGRPGQSRPVSRPMGQSKNDLVGEVTSGLTQLLDGVLKHFPWKTSIPGTSCWCSLSCSSIWRGTIWSWSSPWA